jgi:hypothetical protein
VKATDSMSTPEPLSHAQALRLLSTYRDVERDEDQREAALNDPRIDESVLQEFLTSLPPQARQGALCRCTRPAVLTRWALSNNEDERAVVACNPSTPSTSLRRLAEDPQARVRMQIPFNPNAEPDVLARLILDPDPMVQDTLAFAFDTEAGHALRAGQREFVHRGDADDEPF